MAAWVSGVVWSTLCFEQIDAQGDTEGLLLGQVVRHVTDTISDSQLNNIKEETVTYIYSHVPCHGVFSWYDSGGLVVREKLRKLLPNDKHKQIVGWYKCRRHSSLNISLREKAVHHHLKDACPGVASQNFLFLLCSSSATQNLSTHSFDHLILSHDGRQFQKVSLQIANLKETSHGEYKLRGSFVAGPNSPICNKAFSAQQKDFRDKDGQLRDVISIRNLNTSMQCQLREMSRSVMVQEHEVHMLTTEVQALQERLAQKQVQLLSKPGLAQMTNNHKREPLQSKTQASAAKPELRTAQQLIADTRKPEPKLTEQFKSNPVGQTVKLPERSRVPESLLVVAPPKVPSNGPSKIQEELKDLFTHSPQSSIDEDSTDGRRENVQSTKRKLVPEGEEDQTPLLQPVLLHADKKDSKPPTSSSAGSCKSTSDANVAQSTRGSATKSYAVLRGKTELKETKSKDAFEFVDELIKSGSPVEKENKTFKKTLKGNTNNSGSAEDVSRGTKGKNKTPVDKTKKGNSSGEIRELSSSPPRLVTRETKLGTERSGQSPVRGRGQGKVVTSQGQTRGSTRSRSGSRGRGAKQAASPTF